MKLLFVKIESPGPSPTDGYPVKLFFDPGGDPAWRGAAHATGILPRSLFPANPPMNPSTGAPLTPHDVRDFPAATATPALLQAVGEYLFRLLEGSGVGPAWKALRNKYPRELPPNSEGLRTLLDIEPDELRDLPWEAMTDPPRRLFLIDVCPFARGKMEPEPASPPWALPIRVLIVVACEKDDQNVQWAAEVDRVEATLFKLRQAVDHHVVYRPSHAKLEREYAAMRPHVIHFIGHGSLNASTKQLELDVWDEQAGSFWSWDPSKIDSLVTSWPPRLALINACRSSGAGPVLRTWSIENAFLTAGAAAVLGMQGDIRGAAAAAVASALYKALAAGDPIDRALAKARKEVNGMPEVETDWVLPRLFLTVAPERVISFSSTIGEAERARIQQNKDYADVQDSVDRKVERRRLRGGLEPGDMNARNLTLVLGADKVGKTDLILWCLIACVMRGQRACYVNLNGPRSMGFLDVLRAIRDGEAGSVSPLRQALPEKAFRRWNLDLNALLDDLEPPSPGVEPDAPVVDRRKESLLHVAEDAIARIFDSFHLALSRAADDGTLVVALDHLQGVPDSELTQRLIPRLIQAIALRTEKNVRLVVAASDNDERRLGLKELIPMADVIRLPGFKKAEFATLAREFCLHNEYSDVDQLIAAIESTIKGSDWMPKMLRTIQTIMRAGAE